MKKLYVLLLTAMLLTLAACLTACSAVPMLSLADDKLQPPDSPAKDTGEKADPLPQEWSIRLEQVNKENYAEDDRLLAKGSYQVFQLEPEDGGNTLTVTTQTADSINRYFEQWRKSQLQFLADVTEMARTSYVFRHGHHRLLGRSPAAVRQHVLQLLFRRRAPQLLAAGGEL